MRFLGYIYRVSKVGQPHQCYCPAVCGDLHTDLDDDRRLASPDPHVGLDPRVDEAADSDDPPLDHREAGNPRSTGYLRNRRDGRRWVLRRRWSARSSSRSHPSSRDDPSTSGWRSEGRVGDP